MVCVIGREVRSRVGMGEDVASVPIIYRHQQSVFIHAFYFLDPWASVMFAFLILFIIYYLFFIQNYHFGGC